MKTLTILLAAVSLVGNAFAAPGFFVEAGAGHATFTKAEAPAVGPELFSRFAFIAIYSWKSDVRDEQRSKTFPELAAGYRFSDRFALRLSYQTVRDLTTETVWWGEAYIGPPTLVALATPVFRTTTHDDIHVVGLAPELTLPLVGAFSMTFAPELNWVAVRSDVREVFETYAPEERLSYSRSQDKFRLGVSAGVACALTDRAEIRLRYKYADFRGSFDRAAHETIASFRWKF